MSKHISVVFPGQGSQSLGMLDHFSKHELDSSNFNKNFFDFDLLDVVASDSEKLNQSFYTQPALVLASHLYFNRLLKLLPNPLDLSLIHI